MKRNAAVSLIELVVVIAILGIITVLSVERVAVSRAMRSRIAANELVTNLRYIRNTAIRSERTTRVGFDPGANSYLVYICDASNPGDFVPLLNPVDRSDWVVYISDRFPGASLDSVNIDGGDILFFHATNGIPLGANGSALSNTGTIVFDAGLIVTVAPETGYIEIAP